MFMPQVLKLGFTVGIIPSLNIAAGLIGFCGIKGIVGLANLMHFRLWAKPFTRYVPSFCPKLSISIHTKKSPVRSN